MRTNREIPLCRYRYDALDRLDVCTPAEQASTGRFYQENRLATEIQGWVQHSIFQYDDQLLAQHQRRGGTVATTLLSTDQQRSVLNALDATPPRSRAYTPYGHHPVGNGLLSLLGFNGERPDPVTGHYHLGNGYRQFNPVLMRFNSPDSWSPFGKGGINAYAYCAGNPINRTDPTGHVYKRLVEMVKQNGGVDGAEFTFLLSDVSKELGGTKGVKVAAALAGTAPEMYLFSKAVNSMMDTSEHVVHGWGNLINASNSLTDVIGNAYELAAKIERYQTVSLRLTNFSKLMDSATTAKKNGWGRELPDWAAQTKRLIHDKIISLNSTPPPYSIDDPFPPPPYNANGIRKA